MKTPWTHGVLALLVILAWFAALTARPLFEPDEGRYAEVPREMLAGGDWVVPHLNGVAYVEKPPLQYWFTAAALYVFGCNEFAARFYTAVCGLATAGLAGFAARRLWGSEAAVRAVVLLMSMLLFVVLGQLLTLDMSLTCYMTASLVAFLLAQQAGSAQPRDARAERRWMLLAWTAAALGVLTKGLVAAAVPAAVLLAYSLYARDASPWRRLHARLGLPLFLAITVPWHWLAAARLPGFLQFFFVHEHLARYLTPSADREEPWWFFAAVFLLGTAPWTCTAVRVLVGGWRRPAQRGRFDPTLFVWIWVVFICVFFSCSDSKLIPYILPAFPGVALLAAASSARALRRDLVITAAGTVAAAAACAVAAAFAPRWIGASERGQYFALLAQPLYGVALLLALTGVLGLLRRERAPAQGAVLLGVGWCLTGLLLMRAAALVAPIYSGIVLARALDAPAAALPIYSVATYDQTLEFYWQRTVTLAGYRGELDYGLQLDPSREVPSVARFVAQWRDLRDGYAVMERALYQDLQREGVPMHEVARDVRRVLVRRQ